ncbi:MAG: formyltransferase family protein [Alphaproteobacteria bacterium]
MKFIYCGYDFMLPLVHRLREDGHEPVGILTFPCDNIFNFNTETIKFAYEHDLPIHIEKPQHEILDFFYNKGCDVIIAAGYLYKIPPSKIPYGLNIHPSLLPRGRGIMPLPYILLDHQNAAGFTIHKLAAQFDSGDILYQEPLPLSATETVETLTDRMLEQVPKALSMTMKDLPAHWRTAKPQDESTAQYFPPPTDQMRLLDWKLPLERLDKIARAFGHFGSLADFGGHIWAVYAHDIKKTEHSHAPGTILSTDTNETRIAANGGIFIIKKFEQLK